MQTQKIIQLKDAELKWLDMEGTITKFGSPSHSLSRIIVICADDDFRWETTVSALRRSIKKHGVELCRNCALKRKWKDDEYKNKREVITERLKNDVVHLSKIKQFWTEENKLKASTASKKLFDDDIFKTNHKLTHSDESYRESQRIRSINHFSSNQQARLMVSDFFKNKWKDDEYRTKQLSVKNSVEYKEKQSQIATNKWKEDEYRSNQSLGLCNHLKSGTDSGIERVTQSILETLNLEYIRHHHIGYYEFDLFIPSKNILIECQGEYWHSSDQNKRRDAAKFSYIDNNFPHLKLIYLYERDFLNPEIVKSKLTEQSGKPATQVDFDLRQVSIKKLFVKDKLPKSHCSAPEEFLQSLHYAKYGRSAKMIYGAYLDDKLISVCKFSSPIRKEVATSIDTSFKRVLELDRFCIHPSYQKKNFASWMISRCSKLLFDELQDIETLISFADSTYDHAGTIYRASNWKELGKVKKDYHYINVDSYVIHKKTLYNHARSMKMTEKEYAIKFGYMKVFGKEKTKFAYYR